MNHKLIARLFISFCALSFTIIAVICAIYYYQFWIVVEKNELVTPVIIDAPTKELKSEGSKKLYQKLNPFGFIYYNNGDESYEEIQKVNSTIRSLFPNRTVYIAIDQEGGLVDRLRHIAKERNLQLLKKASYYGSIADKNLKQAKQEIYQDSLTTAKLLKELGFNLNLAPMLDLSKNEKDSRAYHHNPKIAYELGLSFIKGMHKHGIMTTIKHLPGIGRNKQDTHEQEVHIDASPKDLRNHDIVPFKKLAKISQFGMVTHAIFTKIDDKPATISKKTVDFIKESTEFNGLLISDAFNMKGVSKRNSYADNAIQSFNAGIDIIIPNCSDHYCDVEVIEAAKKIGYLEKFNKKLRKFERRYR